MKTRMIAYKKRSRKKKKTKTKQNLKIKKKTIHIDICLKKTKKLKEYGK